MKRYTIGILLFQDFSKVLLIQKIKPEWQAGKLNFPGGKLEEGDETAAHCVQREFYEETNLAIPLEEWKCIGIIRNDDEKYNVDVFTALYDYNRHGEPYDKTDEKVMWCKVDNLPANIISNIRWLIHFAINTHQQGNFDLLQSGIFNYVNRK